MKIGQALGAIAIVGVIILAVVALVMFGTGNLSVTDGGITGGTGAVPTYDYTGKNVEFELNGKNLYNGSDLDPTYSVWSEEPALWGDGASDVAGGTVATETSSSGLATLELKPGTYFVRAVLSGYYDEFFTVVIPSGGDVSLSDYNDGGEDSVNVRMMDIETLSISNADMGIVTNETSDITYTVTVTTTMGEDEGYQLKTLKFQEDATYAFATDTDGDNTYDEGINKIVFTLDGAHEQTLFQASTSTDDFGGDDTAIISFDSPIVYDEKETMTLQFQITCDATLDTTGDADEKCGNGEDFLDSVIILDANGNSATFDITG